MGCVGGGLIPLWRSPLLCVTTVIGGDYPDDRMAATAKGRAALNAYLALRGYYLRNGYTRTPRDPDAPTSHRGYELRFTARDGAERDHIVGLLRRVGIKAGKPFSKGAQWRIPVYGDNAVSSLLSAMQIE